MILTPIGHLRLGPRTYAAPLARMLVDTGRRMDRVGTQTFGWAPGGSVSRNPIALGEVGGIPLIPIIIGVTLVTVSVSGAVIARAARDAIIAWKDGRASLAETRQAMDTLLGSLVEQLNRGEISALDYRQILEAIQEAIPGTTTPAGSPSGNNKLPAWTTPLLVGVATTVLGSLILASLR